MGTESNNVDIDILKQQSVKFIDEISDRLIEVSHSIHSYAEMAFEEFKSCSLLANLLEESGFRVDTGIAGMDTSFKAVFGKNKDRPTIALLAEYDALPNGHSCGHNIIGAAAVGAGIGVSRVISQTGGKVVVFGCPAEEGGGGKVLLVNKGFFEDVDAALMIHPIGGSNMIGGPNLAVSTFTVKYHGRSAHAASDPDKGINALDAVMLAFQCINALRQHVTPDVRLHGCITRGGDAPNVIPDYSEAKYMVRAAARRNKDQVAERVLKCFEAGALATGCSMEIEPGTSYANRVVNMAIAQVLKDNLSKLGLNVPDEPQFVSGSTDFGDVSQVVPSVCLYLSIADNNVPSHSNEMREAAVSPQGDKAVLDGAKVMAMTAIDLLCNRSLLQEAKREFYERVEKKSQ